MIVKFFANAVSPFAFLHWRHLTKIDVNWQQMTNVKWLDAWNWPNLTQLDELLTLFDDIDTKWRKMTQNDYWKNEANDLTIFDAKLTLPSFSLVSFVYKLRQLTPYDIKLECLRHLTLFVVKWRHFYAKWWRLTTIGCKWRSYFFNSFYSS